MNIVSPVSSPSSYSLASTNSVSSTVVRSPEENPNSITLQTEVFVDSSRIMNQPGIFGVDLSITFNVSESDAPELLKLLTNEIERKAKHSTHLDLYKLYRTKIPIEHLIELRDKLNVLNVEHLRNVNISNYEIQYLVSILKRYLRELPDPVIPVKLYDQFINTLKQTNVVDKQAVINLMHLINIELPEHHRCTLKWLMSHLCKICCLQYERGNRDYPLTLVQVWCHIFLRPPWEKIKKIVYNTPEHIRIMELLLLQGDWNVQLPDFVTTPPLPPRKISRPSGMQVPPKQFAIVSPQPHIPVQQPQQTVPGNFNNPFLPLPVKPIQSSCAGSVIGMGIGGVMGLHTIPSIPESLYNVTMKPQNPPPILAAGGPTGNSGTNPVTSQLYSQTSQATPIKQLPSIPPSVPSPFTKPSGPPGQCPPTTAQTPGPVENLNLNDQEWYWGNISRDEVKEKLMDARDGTFLVRDASSGCGEYTLTLKKDGTDRVIKIFHNNGKYGFTQDCTINTVVELINYYRSVSLKVYNNILDIKLMYPVSKFQMDDDFNSHMDMEEMVQKFVELTTNIKSMTDDLGQSFETHKKTENDMNYKRQAQEAFNEAEQMFTEQLTLQDRYRREAQPHEIKKLDQNNVVLTTRRQALMECKKNLESDLEQKKKECNKLERDINLKKQEINSLLRQEKRFKQIMISRGLNESLIKQIMEDGISAWQNRSNMCLQPHMDESLWFFPQYKRQDAERVLAKTETGTFLVRVANTGDYALSISCNGCVNHCIIYKTDKNTYGFAEPYNIYDSLKSLVLHYSTNSLEEHNDSLQTTLKYPYKHYVQHVQTQQSSGSGSTNSNSSSSNSTATSHSTTLSSLSLQ